MPRFASICRKEMVESLRPNLLRFVMMYGIMAIILIWGGYLQYSSELPGSHYSEDIMWNMTVTLFVIAIHIMGMLSASFVMERMKSKTGRINILMTPRHHVRKVPRTMADIYFCLSGMLSDSIQTGRLDTRSDLQHLLPGHRTDSSRTLGLFSEIGILSG